jgi:hypothetical protein
MYIDSTFGGIATSDQVVAALLQKHIEPLTAKYRVNLAIYGHNHSVQRLSAAFNNTLVQRSSPVTLPDGTVTNQFTLPNATVHMVIGTAGAAFTRNNQPVPPPWSERVFFAYGYARIFIRSAAILDWEWVANNGTVVDRVRIVQYPTGDDAPPARLSPATVAGIVVGAAVAMAALSAAGTVFVYRRRAGAAGFGRGYSALTRGHGAGDSALGSSRAATLKVKSTYGAVEAVDDHHASDHAEPLTVGEGGHANGGAAV